MTGLFNTRFMKAILLYSCIAVSGCNAVFLMNQTQATSSHNSQSSPRLVFYKETKNREVVSVIWNTCSNSIPLSYVACFQ